MPLAAAHVAAKVGRLTRRVDVVAFDQQASCNHLGVAQPSEEDHALRGDLQAGSLDGLAGFR
eukprot:6557671-Pyramimonas_sp.AAC.1